MMNEQLVAQAKQFVGWPYKIAVAKDKATDGRPIFLAGCPELPGCMAQGWTIDEAVASLEDAKLDYIVSLLEDGLHVPIPERMRTATTGPSENYVADAFGEPSTEEGTAFADTLELATNKVDREALYQLVAER